MPEGERFSLDLAGKIGNMRANFHEAKPWLIKNFLLLGLFTAVVWAIVFPLPGKFLKGLKVGPFAAVSTCNVIIIFFLSGLTLKTDDLFAALKAWQGLLYGFFAILFLTPCAGFIFINLPLETREFAIGLTLFCCVPTTLTSGVTMVRTGGGNWVLATLLTVGTNIIAVFTIPVSLKVLLQGQHVQFDILDLLWKLSVTKLVPLIIGKLLRELIKPIGPFTARHKTFLGLFNNFNLLMIVWQTASSASEDIRSQTFADMCLVVFLGIVIHVLYLTVNLGALAVLRLRIKEHRAVYIMSSQKTLPVAMAVLSFLPETIGEKGLISIPCIVGHLSQLFIDSAIISSWADADAKQKAKQELAAPAPAEEELQVQVEAEAEGPQNGVQATDSKI